MSDEPKINDAEIEEIRNQLEECQRLKDEYLAGWQRARADFLNYKKEEMERINGLLHYAQEEMLLKILPVLDNFYIIEKNIPEDLKKDKNIQGLLLMQNQILDFLKSHGVTEIISVGEKFDPNLHEAIAEIAENELTENSSPSAIERGIIVEEIQKGYKINGRLLRPAKVKITK